MTAGDMVTETVEDQRNKKAGINRTKEDDHEYYKK
jgi:hypothetical protein